MVWLYAKANTGVICIFRIWYLQNTPHLFFRYPLIPDNQEVITLAVV